jgi:hypothetical protein
LEDALLGVCSLTLLRFHSSAILPFFLATPAEAFPDSFAVAATAIEECWEEFNIVRPKDPKAELSLMELMASIKDRLQPVAALGLQLRDAAASVFKILWPGRAEPDTIDRLLQWMMFVSNRVDVWKESPARAGAEQALSSVLSWYQGIDLDQLEHLRKDGLGSVDSAKLRHRVCAIAECTDTDTFFDVGDGDSDESADDMDFEAPSFMEASEKTPEDIAGGSAPPSPDGADFMLAVRTADGSHPKPADAPANS